MYLMLTQPLGVRRPVERSEETFKKIKNTILYGLGSYAYTYKLHWLGAQQYSDIDAPKKLLFTPRPSNGIPQFHDEIIAG